MQHLSRRRFLAGGVVAALGGAVAVAGCAPATQKASSGGREGGSITALGQGMGKHGSFDVEISLTDGAIDRITVLNSRETPGIGDVAMEKLTKRIIDNQTLNVDTISGATLSSMAFLTAVSSALGKAGEKASKWQSRDKAEPEQIEHPSSADVVVIGSGGAGFAAAITASKQASSVILLEKMEIFGGSTALSGGEMAVPGNWIQLKEGIQDNPSSLAQDILSGGDNIGDPALINVIAEGVWDSSQWLTYEAGVAWKHDLMQFGGHSVKRSIIPITHSGSEMTTKLTLRAEQISNLSLLSGIKALELKQENGKISGVIAQNSVTKEEFTISCKAVVMATGGFGNNLEMRVAYNSAMNENILSTDAVGATGDGIVMGQAVGADLVDMEYIQTYPVCDPETGALLYVGDVRLEYHGLLVNKEGKRFVEELDRRDVISNAIVSQTEGTGYLLFNQSGADETGLLETHRDEYENSLVRGIIAKGDTVEDVCQQMGIASNGVNDTIEKWNDYCAQGVDAEWGYRGKMNPIDGGPYYLMACKPAVHYTMGGLRINPKAEVLDVNMNPIPGLYAAGEVAGHKMGTNRLGSCSMADIYTFGRIAGENAASYSAE